LSDKSNFKKDASTIAARAGGFVDNASGGVTPPLQPSTTFIRDENYELSIEGNSYGRDNNDQVRLAEDILCALEGGEDTLLFASGMAAISTLLSSLKAGEKLLVQSDIYWGTTSWVRNFCAHRDVMLIEADASETKIFCDIIQAEKPNIVFVETPSNPWLKTVDISAVSKAVKSVSAVLAVDATAATPILMKPLTLGADIVAHSATKAINGHSDVLAGVLTCADAASDVWEFCKTERHGAGAILSANSAWMLIRGMRTLPLRIERMCENAMKIAEALEAHKKIEAVWYPGLTSHLGYEIASKQMQGGYGCLMSFLVKGGRDEALTFCRHLKGIHRATSLGGTESLVEHRHSIEGHLTDCPPNLIRLSVGIENADDLIAELTDALSHI